MQYNIRQLLYSMRYYLVPLFICWIVSFILLVMMGYQGSFLYLNSHFYQPLDNPMLFLTHVGDDVVVAAIFILIFIKKKPDNVILMLISLLIIGVFSFMFKNVVFPNWDRPPKIFAGRQLIHTVSNYRLYIHSFPSGHSLSIAASCTVVAFISKRSKPLMLMLAFITMLICYTRVYTGVHFLGDILAGSVLGAAISITCIVLFEHKVNTWFYSLSISTQANLSYVLIGLSILALFFTLMNETGYNMSLTT